MIVISTTQDSMPLFENLMFAQWDHVFIDGLKIQSESPLDEFEPHVLLQLEKVCAHQYHHENFF
jgi:hypothetical protein